MALIDYEAIALVARSLLTDAGRTVTFNKFNNVPDTSSQPWNGSTTPRTAVATLEVSAVVVEPSSLRTLGVEFVTDDFIKRSEQIALVSTDTRLDQFDEMVDDDGTRWKIWKISELRPATKSMLYFVGLQK
jgi:hypothetical protein